MAAATLDVDRLRHEWNGIKAKVRERWNNLSDDDLTIHGGNVDQFLNRLHKATGEDRATVETYLTTLLYGGTSAVARQVVEAREHLGERAQQAAHLVRSRPASSMGAAIAVGFVVGVAFGLVFQEH